MCCEDDAFLLPNPLDDDLLSGDASCGGGAAGSAAGRGRPWRRARPGGPAQGRVCGGSSVNGGGGRDRKEGGVGKDPSAELGKGTELRSEMWSGDQGVQAGAQMGQGGQGGKGGASAGEEARKSGGAAAGLSGARRRGRKPPSSDEDGASDGAGDALATLPAPAATHDAGSPQRDAGQIQLAVNRKHCTILDIPLSLNLKVESVYKLPKLVYFQIGERDFDRRYICRWRRLT